MTEISAMYEALDNMDDYALMANVKPIGPHKVLTDAIAELETLRQRVAELESLLKEAYADADEVLRPRVAELANERDKLERDRNHLLLKAEVAMKCIGYMGPSKRAVKAYSILQEAIASVKEG